MTGGAGYIGSHTVVELYISGYQPIIVDNMCNTSERNIIGINNLLKTTIPFHNIDCTDLHKMNISDFNFHPKQKNEYFKKYLGNEGSESSYNLIKDLASYLAKHNLTGFGIGPSTKIKILKSLIV